MSRPATLAPAARREAAAAVSWLAGQNPIAARSLRRAIVDAAALLGARPLAGRSEPSLVGRNRLWSLAGFPYLLVYDPDSDPVRILRMVHSARDLPKLLKEFGS